MIASLRGVVTERRQSGDSSVEVVIDVAGVGYRVTVAPSTAASLSLGQEAALAVHTHVRESAVALYGFASSEERRAFELLLGAHGVGPGLALAILGVHGPAQLAQVVASGDIEALKLVPGIGQKTAARLLMELQTRLEGLGGDGVLVQGAPGTGSTSSTGELSEALTQLGYSPEEVRSAIRGLPRDAGLEELLRLALRNMAPRR
jgi:Holliday junction DNA helicase RuvA